MTLRDFFTAHPKAALAFSGGTDSAYLLYEAVRSGADVQPYFVKSAFQPAFELADAERLCEDLGVTLRLLKLDVLAAPHVAENPAERCYWCKTAIFSALTAAARSDGYELVLDGTNASDRADDRPGMRALRELGVRSPLRECGVTKAEVRRLSAEAGLFTAAKPSYACLATRVPTGESITEEKLHKVEEAESRLFTLGYSDLRLRLRGDEGLLQLPEGQLARAREHWAELQTALADLFETLTLDPRGR